MKNRELPSNVIVDIYEAKIKELEDKLKSEKDYQEKKKIDYNIKEYKSFIEKIKDNLKKLF
jgi:hypothetical protein